jgi:polyisoprenoid-binding protein YceI
MSTVTALLSSPESVGVWNLLPQRSVIGFKTKTMWGLIPVKGRFHEFSGDGQITETATVFGRLDIKAASLDTRLRKRDTDLRSPAFFDVEKYPDLSVVVTGAEVAGDDTVDVRTDLTVKETTAPLPLQVKVAVLDDGAVRVTAQTTIDRKQFGVDGNMLGMVGDKTTLSADLVFRRAAG